jgi:transcription antitermination factor NusG
MSDIYFIQVKGGAQKEMAESLLKKSKETDVASNDNLIIVPEEIEPLNRQEAIEYLEQMAAALDMEVSDESG